MKNDAGTTMSLMCSYLKGNQILTGSKIKIYKNKNHKLLEEHGVSVSFKNLKVWKAILRTTQT